MQSACYGLAWKDLCEGLHPYAKKNSIDLVFATLINISPSNRTIKITQYLEYITKKRNAGDSARTSASESLHEGGNAIPLAIAEVGMHVSVHPETILKETEEAPSQV